MQILSYSIPNAAKVVGLSPTSIWRLIQGEELVTFKIGGRTLIRADVLQAFVDKKSAQSCIN